MPTLFERIKIYSDQYKFAILNQPHRARLGKKVTSAYFKNGGLKRNIKIINVQEPDCFCRVILYPEAFTGTMDRMIAEYYRSIRAIPRTRSAKPVASFKPSGRK